ncbi:hypothetical protein [Deinococcus multiflagellatus]|uniref:Uncharacterized protein n=1 Tax=Deinococcus multiflagellatus TaxID=1656887 RepID=A0ABW1ZPI4_9DEIO|nr:hypothetical protein [Deinococcus multiflagellatus]MBZ9715383.1 hypothetical protein [Deinococcus multiflagellatus]
MTRVLPLRSLIGVLMVVLAFGAPGVAQDPCWKCGLIVLQGACLGC